MKLNRKLSISHWNVSNGITFLINPHWNCLRNHQAVFLYSESFVATAEELVFRVKTLPPTDVIDEYEFLIRPNNEYHRNLLHGSLGNTFALPIELEKIEDLTPFDYDLSGQSWNIMLGNRYSLQPSFARLYCLSCRISGSNSLYSNLKGSNTKNKLDAVFKTGITSSFNSDLKLILEISNLEISSKLPLLSWKHSIFKFNFLPISIPGLFSIGKIMY
jgi:hypothetical protein